MSAPSVSLCIPLWEPKPEHLRSLLASIQTQRHRPAEVVVVDDGRMADLEELVAEFSLDGVSVVRNPERLGMVANWNRSVALAGGELVMVLGQDDVLGDDLLARYVAEFRRDPEVVACSSGEIWIGDGDEEVEVPRRPNRRERIFLSADRYVLDQADLVRLCLRNGQVYGEPSAVMFRRSAFEAVGGYHEEFGHVADLDLDLRLAGEGPVVYLPVPLVRRRIHAGMTTIAQQASGETAAARERLHRHWVSHTGLTPRDRARARVALASWAARDAAKAVVARRWDLARRQLAVVRRYGRNPPRYVVENVVELATGANRDAR